MRIAFAADLHLGAGSDYGRAPGERLEDQRDAWLRACRHMTAQGCDKLVFLGDAFHRPRPTPAELEAFADGLAKAPADPIIIVGNHDVSSADLPAASSIFRLGGAVVWQRPAVWHGPGVDVAVLPWAPRAKSVSADEMAAKLVTVAAGLRASIESGGRRRILALHWSLAGATIRDGFTTDELREVVLPTDELVAQGWDFIAAGHIHKRQEVAGFANVAYVGSGAVVDFSEADGFHGWLMLDTDDMRQEWQPVADRRFMTLDLTAEQAAALEPGVALPLDVREAVLRIRYDATREQAARIDHARLRQALLDGGAHQVYSVEARLARAERARLEVDTESDPVQAVVAWCAANVDDADLGTRAVTKTADYLSEAA